MNFIKLLVKKGKTTKVHIYLKNQYLIGTVFSVFFLIILKNLIIQFIILFIYKFITITIKK